jgi:hypothetical protein
MLCFFDLSIDVGFGSALNIETLVAAAEKRETPIRCSSYLQEIDQIGRFLEFIYNYDQYFKIISHFYFVLVKSFVVSLCVSSSAYVSFIGCINLTSLYSNLHSFYPFSLLLIGSRVRGPGQNIIHN